MRSALALFVCLLLLAPMTRPASAEDAPGEAKPAAADIEQARLEAHVGWLAAPERKGRGCWPEREASAAYIAQAFAEAGLVPLPGRDSMFHDQGGVKAPALRNVVAWLPGPEGSEHVILSAHYDHLGEKVTEIVDGETSIRTSMTFAGADDNASGVGALLEIARCLGARHKAAPTSFRRGLVFVAFDLEEQQLLGSKHYVAEPPLPLERLAAFVTMDMLGRSVADLAPGHLFVMGTESSAALAAHVAAAGVPEGGRLSRIGIDFQPGYSDYEPFRDAQIPYVFLTSGACEDYHQTGDVAPRIQFDQLLARTRWARDLTMRIVQGETRPTWRDEVAPSVEELEDLRALIRTIEKGMADVPGLPPMAVMVVGNYGAFLDKVLADGAVTAEERNNARLGALNLFRIAQQLAAQMAGGR